MPTAPDHVGSREQGPAPGTAGEDLFDEHEFGAFLRAHRAALSPEAAGLPTGRQLRRVPGLRREEVALLANISPDYYTRLERGKLPPPSPHVVDALSGALQLSDVEHRYLHDVAAGPTGPLRLADPSSVDPHVKALLEHRGHLPAMIVGRLTEVLAWNRSAQRLFVDFASIPSDQRLVVRMMFLQPDFASRFCDWEPAAVMIARLLRRRTAGQVRDPLLRRLVLDLSSRSDIFAAAWAGHGVADLDRGHVRFNHPEAGELTLSWQALTAPERKNHTVCFLLPDAVGGETDQRLRALHRPPAPPA